jgi:hypothetical protein
MWLCVHSKVVLEENHLVDQPCGCVYTVLKLCAKVVLEVSTISPKLYLVDVYCSYSYNIYSMCVKLDLDVCEISSEIYLCGSIVCHLLYVHSSEHVCKGSVRSM